MKSCTQSVRKYIQIIVVPCRPSDKDVHVAAVPQEVLRIRFQTEKSISKTAYKGSYLWLGPAMPRLPLGVVKRHVQQYTSFGEKCQTRMECDAT